MAAKIRFLGCWKFPRTMRNSRIPSSVRTARQGGRRPAPKGAAGLPFSCLAHGWSLERMNRVDLAILRVAVFEILAGQVPEPVVVNEAVELSKQYSTERSPAFINGVLGSIRRARQ